ncbi:LSU ribosomal protein L21P [Sinomicrobium oceani]|uniref:Large ribosomal subunit protein bL21 n=1 Tax=Sinomicrobium oceani TaxID=1150368 RepID=A0A1K1N0V0_9FLAO|nr:50S ribosomal protein L21 [Sinomicrobium oceani]SFW27926.1 LSU ribosomal protein L21P [Sinomicrobium oceani]
MYAIVEIAGQQFKVAKDQKVFVHRLAEDEGAKVSFDNVLLVDNGGDITVGAPAIDGASIEAKVVKHLKGDKVIVFKKKRRKGYKVKNGHRQALTEIVIESIVGSGAKKSASKANAEKAEKPAKKAPAKKATKKGDDLKKIEGIGPKIAELFNNTGIITYADLAATSVDKLKDILTEAGPNYANKVPDTWPQQAQLAADGKWDELNELQEKLDGGIEK